MPADEEPTLTATLTAEPNTGENAPNNARQGPFGGLDPSAAGKRSAEAKRLRRREREMQAAADTLTLSARVATVAARELTQVELAAYVRRLARIRDEGTDQQAIAATKACESLLRLALAIPEGADAALGADPAQMTREQRAAERAALEATLAREENTGEGTADQAG